MAQPAWDPSSPAAMSYLDFLSDELLFGNEPLDSATLAAAAAADQGGKSPSGRHKKRVKSEGAASGRGDDGSSDDDIDDEPSSSQDYRQKGKKGKAAQQQAAVNKACREKARREKLNDRSEYVLASSIACFDAPHFIFSPHRVPDCALLCSLHQHFHLCSAFGKTLSHPPMLLTF